MTFASSRGTHGPSSVFFRGTGRGRNLGTRFVSWRPRGRIPLPRASNSVPQGPSASHETDVARTSNDRQLDEMDKTHPINIGDNAMAMTSYRSHRVSAYGLGRSTNRNPVYTVKVQLMLRETSFPHLRAPRVADARRGRRIIVFDGSSGAAGA